MKNLISMAIVAIFALVIAGCSSRNNNGLPTSASKNPTPKSESMLVPKKATINPALLAVQKTTQKLEVAFASLNSSNASLQNDCSVLLPGVQKDEQGNEKLWLGYDKIVASTERPVTSLESMLGFLCVLNKDAKKLAPYPHRLVVSEEFTLLKRRVTVLRTCGIQIAVLLEAQMGQLEQKVGEANVLLAQLYNEIQAAKKNAPSNSPLGRLGNAQWFASHVIEADIPLPSPKDMDWLKKMAKAFDPQFVVVGGVTNLRLSKDAEALLDLKKAAIEGEIEKPAPNPAPNK